MPSAAKNYMSRKTPISPDHPAISTRRRGRGICQPWAIDSGNKTSDSAHDMASGDLAVDAMAIGCLGVELCDFVSV